MPLPPGIHPPLIVNDGHRIIRTDYFDEGFPMRLSGIPWLDCHLGYLRLLYTNDTMLVPKHRWSFCEFAILTRGPGKEHVEMLELFFPSEQEERAPLPVYLFPWQCNRLPSWQPGKRCWELEVYAAPGFAETAPGVFLRRRVFYREGKIPCRQWWEGPRQDGSPHAVQRKLTPEEFEAKLREVKESRRGPDAGPKKPKGRFVSEKETARRLKNFRDRQERKRLEGR